MNVFRLQGSCFGGDCLFAGWILGVVRRGSIFFRRKSTTYFRYVQDVGFRICNWGMRFRNWGMFLLCARREGTPPTPSERGDTKDGKLSLTAHSGGREGVMLRIACGAPVGRLCSQCF